MGDPKSPSPPGARHITRRGLLGTTGAAIAGTLAAQLVTTANAQPAPAVAPGEPPPAVPPPADTTRTPGAPMAPLSERARFEQPARKIWENLQGISSTPLQDLHGTITPSDLHFTRHHAGVPDISPDAYRLLVHGRVERPLVFTLADLQRFPSVSRICFVECSGNGIGGYRNPLRKRTPQDIDGGTSNSEWTGVLLSVLLREAGVKGDASWLLCESQDAARYSRSVPIAKAWDDALVAYGQNGEALRAEQGYPARLLLPGWEGSASVKWLRRVKVSDRPFWTREETARYSDLLPDGRIRMFAFEMDAKSIITSPAYPETLVPGWREIRGIAWTGRGLITRVDVSTDAGSTWQAAELQAPILPKAHTRFRLPWRWDGAAASLMSRATDETGYVQPTLEALRKVRVPGNDYHFNNIRVWTVEPDGRVFFGLGGGGG